MQFKRTASGTGALLARELIIEKILSGLDKTFRKQLQNRLPIKALVSINKTLKKKRQTLSIFFWSRDLKWNFSLLSQFYWINVRVLNNFLARFSSTFHVRVREIVLCVPLRLAVINANFTAFRVRDEINTPFYVRPLPINSSTIKFRRNKQVPRFGDKSPENRRFPPAVNCNTFPSLNPRVLRSRTGRHTR